MSRIAHLHEPKRRREVIETATRIFCQKGFATATIQDIADCVGILKGSLYHYFPSKEALLEEIVTSAHDDAWARVTAARDTEDSVHELVSRYLQWAATRPHAAALLLEHEPSLTGPAGKRIARLRTRHRDLLADSIGATHDDVDPRLAAEALLGFLTAACRSNAFSRASAVRLGAMVGIARAA